MFTLIPSRYSRYCEVIHSNLLLCHFLRVTMGGDSTYSHLQHDSHLKNTTPVADDETSAGYESLSMPVREHTETTDNGEDIPVMEYSVVKNSKSISSELKL